ncbi:RDD family protein [Demequina sp. TTPB684]|uniref:RDD family protein n=1 Tax=unclassified Demequina TaxID=2620311 RepID=UPI001CF10CFA|nr:MULTISPECIES: RDD family protein [unclassified Demequina]MCB2413187.1 RDD family protein [Demequina sp. TTPB684]UPU88362.1 RDD family protein [Demequina sp. TMPB413]
MTTPAPLGRRIVAALIDYGSLSVLTMVAAIPAMLSVVRNADDAANAGAALGAVGLVWAVSLGGWAVLVALKGSKAGSPGMRLMGTRLVRVDTGAPLGFGRAALRQVVLGATSGIVIGALSPLFHPQRRGWHDLAVGSIMVGAAASSGHAPTAPAAAAAPPPPPPPPPVPHAVSAPVADADADQAPAVHHEQPSVITAVPGFAPPPAQPPSSSVQAPASPQPPPPPSPASAPPAASPPPPPPPPPTPEPPQGTDSAEEDLDATRVAAPRARVAVLTWDDGNVVTVTGTAVMGRNPAAGTHADALLVPITDNTRSLSKTHFAIAASPEGFTITDLHSTNGVVVHRDGTEVAVEPGTPLPLISGDRLVVGDRSASFEVR